MKVLVLGASGRTGRLVVEEALDAGHEVTAFCHEPQTFGSGVRVVIGDSTRSADIERAMTNQDAVIDAVGETQPYKKTELEAATARNVVDAMRLKFVPRLVVISMLGVGDSVDQASFLYEHILLPTFLRGGAADKAAMETTVREAGLDFVIVRPALLSDHEQKAPLSIVEGDAKAHTTGRADLARFLVQQLTDDSHLGRALVVANS